VFVSATASHGTCTQSRTVVCSFGTIPAGASRVAKVTARVQVAAALLHNVAVVTTSTVDTNAGNNTSHANVRVAATAAQQKVLKAKPAAVHAQPKFTG
jgi:hypothetical protein